MPIEKPIRKIRGFAGRWGRIPPTKRMRMPRPKKTFRRMKINAAIAYKRGDRKEAYGLWKKAAAGTAEHLKKKKSRGEVRRAEAEAKAKEAAEAAASSSEG